MSALIEPSRAMDTAAAFGKAPTREPQQVDTAITHQDGHVDLSVTVLPIIVGDEDKSLFLANVSHEVRTPLTTLLGLAEVLMDTDLDPSRNGSSPP